MVIAKELDDRLLPFYRANGYERDEVERYFRAGSAFYCAIYENGEPVAACMAFENYGSIWEIAGLYTIERTRRQGLARDVVTTALSTLIKNGYIPRYQMDEGNIASKQLALDLGLSLFLTTEHFIGVKRSDKYRSHSRHRV